MAERSPTAGDRYAYEPLVWVITPGIAAVDLLLPPGYAAGVLYVGVILFGLWIRRRAFVFQYAVVATGLVAAGLLVPGTGGSWTMGLFNRVVSLGALWVTAGGITLFLREAEARQAAEGRVRELAALAELGKMAGAVAHDVRNALAGIGASIQILIASARPEAREDGLASLLSQRLARLDEMVTDLLAFVETRPMSPSAVSLRRLVDEAATQVRAKSEFQYADVRIDVPETVVTADADAVRRALFNLILNGVQAVAGRGAVVIRGEVCGRHWQLEVADQGPGIPPTARARLFEPFFSTKTHGVGLGLAFAKRVVRSHGGTIDVSCPLGGGTVVSLRVPM
jgi:signal transduction histidine kinase